MKYFNFLKRNIKTGLAGFDLRYYSDKKVDFKHILILNKRTRYELESVLRPGINDDQLENIIRKRGSDFDRIIKHHNQHKEFLNKIVKNFSNFGAEVKIVNRTNYGEKEVEWADLIVVGGGDGTFLLGASQIHNQDKPIVGFNTDPERSEGYLCLPKKCTFDISTAVEKIMKNEFKWLLRNRIEVKIKGVHALDEVVVLDSTKVKRYPDCIGSQALDSDVKNRILPSLALNEVFMGEFISSQVSHLLVKPDNLPATSVKCSGICVSTGTGSTSWHMSINRLTEDKVKKLLCVTGQSLDNLKAVTEKYNALVRFSPEDSMLAWSLREPIYGSVFPDPPNFPAGGLTSEISVSSRCFSGFLVIDGTHCYPFHDGTHAHLYCTKERRLRTICLD